MVNYQNGKIYKIINENHKIIYIGSTAEYRLSTRYAKHKLKAPNHKIILIENYACNNREELRKREQEVIEEHTNLINENRAYRSEEYIKEYCSKKNKNYNKNNKEYFIKKNKEWYENNIDFKKEYDKNYRENNRIEINKKALKKYYDNKNEINEKNRQIVNCPFCNIEITRNCLSRHKKQNKKCLQIQNNLKK